jgi:predicted DNA-binding protein (MmcQ/YjbR family)
MHIEFFRQYCIQRPGVEETLPFGPDTLVYKVMGKAFALTGLDDEAFKVNLKCDPERAIELRDTYAGLILPGWHMNKKHWNTVYFEEGLPEKLLLELIDHSYQLVVSGLPKKLLQELEQLNE